MSRRTRARGRQCDRSADDTPCELRQESARSAAHRAGVWLAENDRVLRKVKLRGPSNVHWLVCFAAAAFNLRRLITLMAAPA